MDKTHSTKRKNPNDEKPQYRLSEFADGYEAQQADDQMQRRFISRRNMAFLVRSGDVVVSQANNEIWIQCHFLPLDLQSSVYQTLIRIPDSRLGLPYPVPTLIAENGLAAICCDPLSDTHF